MVVMRNIFVKTVILFLRIFFMNVIKNSIYLKEIEMSLLLIKWNNLFIFWMVLYVRIIIVSRAALESLAEVTKILQRQWEWLEL